MLDYAATLPLILQPWFEKESAVGQAARSALKRKYIVALCGAAPLLNVFDWGEYQTHLAGWSP